MHQDLIPLHETPLVMDQEHRQLQNQGLKRLGECDCFHGKNCRS